MKRHDWKLLSETKGKPKKDQEIHFAAEIPAIDNKATLKFNSKLFTGKWVLYCYSLGLNGVEISASLDTEAKYKSDQIISDRVKELASFYVD